MFQPIQDLDEVLDSTDEASVGAVVEGRIFEAAVSRVGEVDDSDVDELVRQFDVRWKFGGTVVGDKQRACVEPVKLKSKLANF